MFKTIFAATALFVVTASPVVAQDAVTQTFTRDGETYAYTATDKGDRVLLDGRRVSDGSRFHLSVRGDHIDGISNGVPVSFTMANAQARITAPELAAR